jgi:hypothetical protein
MANGIYFYDSAGARRKIKEFYFYDSAGARRKIKEAYFYDSAGVRRQFFSSGVVYNFNGPNTSGTGDSGTGPLYSIAPYPVAPRGSLALVSGTPGATIIGLHFTNTISPQGLWITANVAGPWPQLEGKKLWINDVETNMTAGVNYIGAGFGGYYSVTNTFTNVLVLPNTTYKLEFR